MRAWARWGGTKRWGQLPDLRYATNGENVERTISRARDEFVEIYVTETQNVGIAVNVAKLEAKWGDNPPNRRRTMSGLIFESRVDANGHGHTYVKMTPQAEQDYDEKMARQGFHKVRVELPGSRHGFVWERARAATPAELAEASRGPSKTGQAPKRTEMPLPEECAKPVAAIPGGPVLDETYNWDEIFDGLQQSGGDVRQGRAAPQRPQAVPVRRPDVDSPPPIPVEVLRAQERDR